MTNQFQVPAAHQNSKEALQILLIFDLPVSANKGAIKLRADHDNTDMHRPPKCIQRLTTAQLWNLPDRYDDHVLSVHDRLHACFRSAAHPDETHIPAHNATRKLAVDRGITGLEMKQACVRT